MQFERNLSMCTKWANKLKILIKRYYSEFIPTSVFICLPSSFLFQHEKIAMNTYIILLHMFLLFRETS